MRILICGDRNWTDVDRIKRALLRLGPRRNDTIIHGGARGADRIAGALGKVFGMRVKEFPAQWKLYGKAAGPIRNAQMLEEGNPDVVWACHDYLDRSVGTADMVRKARKAGVPVIYITTFDQE